MANVKRGSFIDIIGMATQAARETAGIHEKGKFIPLGDIEDIDEEIDETAMAHEIEEAAAVPRNRRKGTIETASDVRARQQQLTEKFHAFLKEVQKFMKGKGYSYKRGIQSAAADWAFDNGKKRFVIAGWHGSNPKRWGAIPALHGFYDGREEKVRIENLLKYDYLRDGSLDVTPEMMAEQVEGMTKTLDYLRKNA